MDDEPTSLIPRGDGTTEDDGDAGTRATIDNGDDDATLALSLL